MELRLKLGKTEELKKSGLNTDCTHNSRKRNGRAAVPINNSRSFVQKFGSYQSSKWNRATPLKFKNDGVCMWLQYTNSRTNRQVD